MNLYYLNAKIALNNWNGYVPVQALIATAQHAWLNQNRPTYKQLLCVQFRDNGSSPVKKTVGESVCSNSPAVLESNRSQSPTARTPVPAN